ncbi:MAG: toxin-activating lysine-acyltransferase [Alphaproteobacteria bacterium]|nr:toxin-activating lysine-acyltransferase [Alphaproteobacteria bacterium]
MPAMAHGQYRVWRGGPRDSGVKLGYTSWAFLNEEVKSRVLQYGVKKMAPTDWKTGDRAWLMDVICPMGGADLAIKDLRETVFKGQKVKTLQAAPDGSGVAVVEW